MTLSEYVDLTTTLVKNQARLVEECGYCVSWLGDIIYYDTTNSYITDVKNQLEVAIDEGSIVLDITVQEAMDTYGL